MSIADDIRRELEFTFQLPFDVERTLRTTVPTWTVVPKYGNNIYGLFQVTVEVFKYRVNIKLVPERLSREMMQAISSTSYDTRGEASGLLCSLEEMGGNIDLLINDEQRSTDSPEKWPDEWNSFSITYTRMPLHDRDNWSEVKDFAPDLEGVIAATLVLILESNDELLPLEGKKTLVQSKRYERNPVYRNRCIAKYGCRCQICGFDFEKVYGEIGKGYIQVHHIVPVSTYEVAQTIDPEKDLIPVCPNCHAMLHRKQQVLLPTELKKRNIVSPQ